LKHLVTRNRIAFCFSCLGIVLMGVDLLITRSPFIHIAELMAASLSCLLLGLLFGRTPVPSLRQTKAPALGRHKNSRR